ncbi:PcfJ domain-containing protein [Ancylobacter sp.]|uniref:PcfJ domain-containing protein n=1 Tax=Ancylobacter sp. TaxID=1872567 RepID=UPI003C7CC503
MTSNLANHLKKNEENMGEIEHIIDYLNSDKAPQRLKKMSYKQARAAAERWNTSLQKKGASVREDEADTAEFIDFGDGFRFVRLVGKKAYEREGHLMRHCVASYFGRGVEIYSLRDSDNQPHCTIERDSGINQIKGKGNGHIHPRYVHYVVAFLEKCGLTVRESELANLGYTPVTKEYLHLAQTVYVTVPTAEIGGKTYLYIHGAMKTKPYDKKKVLALLENKADEASLIRAIKANHTHLASLMVARGLTVGDWLDLRGTGITSLPENLTVGDWLDLSGTGITSLSENLTVGGSLYLSGTGITSLPENLTVGGSLYLSGTGITSLSENLTVGGWLDLRGTGITSLSENLTVGGSLDLSGTGITSLPKSAKLKGRVIR